MNRNGKDPGVTRGILNFGDAMVAKTMKVRNVELADPKNLILRTSQRNFEFLFSTLSHSANRNILGEELMRATEFVRDQMVKRCQSVIAANDHVQYLLEKREFDKSTDDFTFYCCQNVSATMLPDKYPWNDPLKIFRCDQLLLPKTPSVKSSLSITLCPGVVDVAVLLGTPHVYHSGVFRTSLPHDMFGEVINIPSCRLDWCKEIQAVPNQIVETELRFLNEDRDPSIDWRSEPPSEDLLRGGCVKEIDEILFRRKYVIFNFIKLAPSILRSKQLRANCILFLISRLLEGKYYRSGGGVVSLIPPYNETEDKILEFVTKGQENYINDPYGSHDPLRMELFLTFSNDYEILIKYEEDNFESASSLSEDIRCVGRFLNRSPNREVIPPPNDNPISETSSLVMLNYSPKTSLTPSQRGTIYSSKSTFLNSKSSPEIKAVKAENINLLPIELAIKYRCGHGTLAVKLLQLAIFSHLAVEDDEWRDNYFFRRKEEGLDYKNKRIQFTKHVGEICEKISSATNTPFPENHYANDDWKSAIKQFGNIIDSLLLTEDRSQRQISHLYKKCQDVVDCLKSTSIFSSDDSYSLLVDREVPTHKESGYWDVFFSFRSSLNLEFLDFIIEKLRRLYPYLLTNIQMIPHFHQKESICIDCKLTSKEQRTFHQSPKRDIVKDRSGIFKRGEKENRKDLLNRPFIRSRLFYPILRTVDDSLYEVVFESEQFLNYLIQLERSWYSQGLSLSPTSNGYEQWSYLPEYEGSISTFRKAYFWLLNIRDHALAQRMFLHELKDQCPPKASPFLQGLLRGIQSELFTVIQTKYSDPTQSNHQAVKEFKEESKGINIIRSLLANKRDRSFDTIIKHYNAWDQLHTIVENHIKEGKPNVPALWKLFEIELRGNLDEASHSVYINERVRIAREVLGEHLKPGLKLAKDVIGKLTTVYHEKVEGFSLRGAGAHRIPFNSPVGVYDLLSASINDLMQDYLGNLPEHQWRGMTATLSENSSLHILPGFSILNVPVDTKINLFPKLPLVAHEAAHLFVNRIGAFESIKTYNSQRYITEQPPRTRKGENIKIMGETNRRCKSAIKVLKNWLDKLINETAKEMKLFRKALLKEIRKNKQNKEQAYYLSLAVDAWYEQITRRLEIRRGSLPEVPYYSEILADLLGGLFGGVPYYISLGVYDLAPMPTPLEPVANRSHPPTWMRLVLGRSIALHFHWINVADLGKGLHTKKKEIDTWSLFVERFEGMLRYNKERNYLKDFLVKETDSKREYTILAKVIINQMKAVLGKTCNDKKRLQNISMPFWQTDAGSGESELSLGGPNLFSEWFFAIKALIKGRNYYFDDLRDWVWENFDSSQKMEGENKELVPGKVMNSRLLFFPPPAPGISKKERREIEKRVSAAIRKYMNRIAQQMAFDKAVVINEPHKYLSAGSVTWPNFRPLFPTGRVVHSLFYSDGNYQNRNKAIETAFARDTRKPDKSAR